TMHVEGGFLVGIAVGTEPVGLEVVDQTAAHATLDRLDLDLVLASAGGRAVRQQVVATGETLDAPADFFEAPGDVLRVLRGEGAGPADGADLGVVRLAAHC